MTFWETAPDPRLEPFVERICFSLDPDGPAAPVRVVPDGCVDLLVSVGERSGAVRAEVFGTKTRHRMVENAEPVQNVAVCFRPGAATGFLGVAAHELVDGAFPLGDLWRGSRIGSRAAELSLGERRALLEDALLARLPDAVDLAGRAAGRIARARGSLRIRDLCAELGVGERRLERVFRDRVGVPPKRFARIVRFRCAWEALGRGAAQTDVAHDLGYADQAHLLRDFRTFAGASPGACVSDSSNRAA